MRKKLLIIVGWLLSIVLLYFTFKDHPFDQLWSTLKSANYFWVLPNVVLIMAAMLYRAYRWQIMIDPIKRIGLSDLFASTMVGFMANNVLPLRMGEFIRAYSIGKLGNLSRSSSFATIVLERIFDTFTLLLMLTVILIARALPLNPEGEYYDRIVYAGYLMLALSIVLLALLVLLKVKSPQTLGILRKLLSIFPKKISDFVLYIFEKFAEGLAVLGDTGRMFRIVLHSILLWIIMALSNYFIFIALGLTDLPWTASFVVLIVVSLGIFVPASPGYIGLFHYLVVLSLSIYPAEVSDSSARGCAIILHASQYIIITVVGIYYLMRRHLSLKEAQIEAEKEAEQEV
ncbi:MAG: flippase-like domain-containing protein [candidate division Zixibacteria bacterium]|nr:flippase-like domain-containing protein [candidate division Zixibacteria bacterium]